VSLCGTHTTHLDMMRVEQIRHVARCNVLGLQLAMGCRSQSDASILISIACSFVTQAALTTFRADVMFVSTCPSFRFALASSCQRRDAEVLSSQIYPAFTHAVHSRLSNIVEQYEKLFTLSPSS
jgi:hypothetical protein